MKAKVLPTVVSVCGLWSCSQLGKKPAGEEASVTLNFPEPPASGTVHLTLQRLSAAPASPVVAEAETTTLGEFSKNQHFQVALPAGHIEIALRVTDAAGATMWATEPDNPDCPTKRLKAQADSSPKALSFRFCRPPKHIFPMAILPGPLTSGDFSETSALQPWPSATGEALALDLLPWFLGGRNGQASLAHLAALASTRNGALEGTALWSLKSRLTQWGVAAMLMPLQGEASVHFDETTFDTIDPSLGWILDASAFQKLAPSLRSAIASRKNTRIVRGPNCTTLRQIMPDSQSVPGVAGQPLNCGDLRRAQGFCEEQPASSLEESVSRLDFVPTRAELAGDCSHLNAQGHRRLASILWQQLRQ